MVERHAYSLAYDNYRTHFIDSYSESSQWIDAAAMVWATQKHGDTYWILQAMAAGKPVISYDTDEATELIEDGKTGRLIPNEDRIRFSAISRELFLDPASAESLGSAASASVLLRLPLATMVVELGKLYHGRGT
jgi:glycosyltransferase involved in cell wall biosynthesis